MHGARLQALRTAIVCFRLACCLTVALAAQAKLGVAAEEFGKWRFASLTNLQAPKLLDDQDVVASRFPVKRVRPSMHACAVWGQERARLHCWAWR